MSIDSKLREINDDKKRLEDLKNKVDKLRRFMDHLPSDGSGTMDLRYIAADPQDPDDTITCTASIPITALTARMVFLAVKDEEERFLAEIRKIETRYEDGTD